MRPFAAFLAITVLAGATVLAAPGRASGHGGKVRLARAPAGPYAVSVWTEPGTPRVGLLDVTVAVMDPATGKLVPGATARVTAREPRGNERPAPVALDETALVILLPHASLELDSPGPWRVTVSIDGPAGPAEAGFDLEVAPPRPLTPWLIGLGGTGVAALLWAARRARRAGRRRVWLALAGVLVLGGVALAGRALLGATREPPGAEAGLDRLDVYATVPDFSLIERSGRPVRRNDLLGNVWLLNFIYTECTDTCPTQSLQVARLQSEFESASDVRFVSITVDPGHDTPAVLAEYAARYRAHPERWLFLTGDKREIYCLARGLSLSVVDPANPTPPACDARTAGAFGAVLGRLAPRPVEDRDEDREVLERDVVGDLAGDPVGRRLDLLVDPGVLLQAHGAVEPAACRTGRIGQERRRLEEVRGKEIAFAPRGPRGLLFRDHPGGLGAEERFDSLEEVRAQRAGGVEARA